LRVLIVDDSVTFRSAIKAALLDLPGIEVGGVAANGKIAIAKLKNEVFDVVILDLEMPELDGIGTLTAIRDEGLTVTTLLFAAPTEAAYAKIRQALSLGAADFLAKPVTTEVGNIEAAVAKIRAELAPRVLALGARLGSSPKATPLPVSPAPSPPARVTSWPKIDLTALRPQAVVLASSTGGPMALERVFLQLKQPPRRPLLICQHMPSPFTKSLAKHLQELSGIPVAEGENGEEVRAGRVYLAPADWHMRLVKVGGTVRIELREGPRINYVIPAADPLFETAADVYGASLAAFVLTGMGEDGKLGAIRIKEKGGAVVVQDRASSIVWGMPGAVVEAGAYDKIAPLDECAATLKHLIEQV